MDDFSSVHNRTDRLTLQWLTDGSVSSWLWWTVGCHANVCVTAVVRRTSSGWAHWRLTSRRSTAAWTQPHPPTCSFTYCLPVTTQRSTAAWAQPHPPTRSFTYCLPVTTHSRLQHSQSGKVIKSVKTDPCTPFSDITYGAQLCHVVNRSNTTSKQTLLTLSRENYYCKLL